MRLLLVGLLPPICCREREMRRKGGREGGRERGREGEREGGGNIKSEYMYTCISGTLF